MATASAADWLKEVHSFAKCSCTSCRACGHVSSEYFLSCQMLNFVLQDERRMLHAVYRVGEWVLLRFFSAQATACRLASIRH